MLFNPSQAYMPNRHRQRSALRTFFHSSSFNPHDSKEPLRRGILFSSVAFVLFLVGIVLIWLGYSDVFGGKIMGPVLVALALLMLLLSLRHFTLARKRNQLSSATVQMDTVNTGSLEDVMMVIGQDDCNGAATILVEAWGSDEPVHETFSYRNSRDLAPPSYMDIAHSCSSNCPSFMSHEDHNEAPPTYEEICGMYNSHSTLNSYSRCSSAQGSPSFKHTAHAGSKLDNTCIQCQQSGHDPDFTSAALAGAVTSNTLPVVGQQDSSQLPVKSVDIPRPLPERLVNSQLKLQSTSSKKSSLDKNIVSFETNATKSSEWSRRSFSSVPSYTCLLSESGEVSSHVFDTSSIIEEMMPLLSVEGAANNQTVGDSQAGAIVIPTRSHSLTSVNMCRQGVPYTTQPHLDTAAGTTAECHPKHHKWPVTGAPFLRCPEGDHQSCNAIAKSSPCQCGDPSLKLGSDSDVPGLLSGQHGPAGSMVKFSDQAHTRTGSLISGFVCSSHGSQSKVKGETELLPLVTTVSDMQTRRKSESSIAPNSPGSRQISSRGRLTNTQDIQETI